MRPPASLEELRSFEDYREFMKESLKLLGEDEPAYVSKEKFAFRRGERTWMGHLFVAGKKVVQSVPKLRSGGVVLREGRCTRERRELRVRGVASSQLRREIERTFLELKLGYRVVLEDAGAEDGPAAAPAGAPGAGTAGASRLAPERRLAIVRDLRELESDIDRLLTVLRRA